MTYQLLKWAIVNTTDADPFKCSNPNETYWTAEEAYDAVRRIQKNHPEYLFRVSRILVPYETTEVPGFGRGAGGGGSTPTHPYNPLAMEALMDKFAQFLGDNPTEVFATKTTATPYTINNQEENPSHDKV